MFGYTTPLPLHINIISRHEIVGFPSAPGGYVSDGLGLITYSALDRAAEMLIDYKWSKRNAIGPRGGQ